MAKLKDLGELSLIEGLAKSFPSAGPGVVRGIGDDCAVFEAGGETLLYTTDIMVEGIHFPEENPKPDTLAKKLLAVNLSDVAAMGGQAVAGLLTVALSPETDTDFWETFVETLSVEFVSRRIDLIGGDTSSSPGPLVLNLVLIGTVDAGRALYRSGANQDDLIYVSRALGDSAAGLALTGSPALNLDQMACLRLRAAQETPQAEEELGPFLAETGLVTAMIDVSDGLATDLGHLARASGLGAEIDLKKLPVSSEAKSLGQSLNLDPINWALSGGEDYALLFTVKPSRAEELEILLREKIQREIYHIGRMTKSPGLTGLDNGTPRPLTGRGYEHFRTEKQREA